VKDLDILVIDSSSSDKTVDIAKQHSVQTVIIPKEEFDHGGTRSLAGKTRSVGDILVYLTQDALPVVSAGEIWRVLDKRLFSFAAYPVACCGDEGEENPP
jgi:hypothetical protein